VRRVSRWRLGQLELVQLGPGTADRKADRGFVVPVCTLISGIGALAIVPAYFRLAWYKHTQVPGSGSVSARLEIHCALSHADGPAGPRHCLIAAKIKEKPTGDLFMFGSGFTAS